MKTSIVIGLGYGDEGKGLTTDYLCASQQNPLVVRFNGGHQAGHTVVTPQGRHVFSSLGSGSFRGAPTYWSSYCTFYPPGYLNEYKALADKGIHALFYLDSHSPVTTFYDVIYNRSLEQSRSPHGSCGVGFGATIERNENGCSLYAGDLWQGKALEPKLELISRYYQEKLASSGNQLLSHIYNSYDLNKIRKSFLKDVRDCTGLCELVEEDSFFRQSQHKTRSMIFEGAQGVLLDMDDGFFPHVTRSNTTSRNAMDLIQKHSLPDPSLYYVSRCYQTRHGAGPMTNEQLKPELYHTEKETNVHNQWQGQFRKSVLDLDLLMYAIACDSRFSEHLNRNLVLTCLDHIAGKIPATYRGRLNMYTAEELAAIILPGARSLITSNADFADHMQHVSRIPKAERA